MAEEAELGKIEKFAFTPAIPKTQLTFLIIH